MFDSTKEDLKDILKAVHEGKLQLPDFQRDYVWGDDDVQSLIASIAKGFPVGALLTLEVGGSVAFKPRVLAGVDRNGVEPSELLLDGQQRMTSLYQALYGTQPIRTRTQKKVEIERFYYLDMRRAVADSANIEEAIVGVPADRVVRANFGREIVMDLSKPEQEYARNLFPLNQVFDHSDWYYRWREYWQSKSQEMFELERKFFKDIVENIQRYKMPIIRLDKDNSREAICLVFEKVNVGGKKLDAFELVTAIYAASNFDLREDWNGPPGRPGQGRRERMYDRENPRRVLKDIQSTDFLQACTLLHTRDLRLSRIAAGAKEDDLPAVSCKREALLALPLSGYRAHSDAIEAGFIAAATFLNELKIIVARDVPYPPQVTALAATFSILGTKAHSAAARDKLRQWFWSITLGEQYGSSTESKLARDVPELVAWIIDGSPKPRSVEEAIFQQDRLLSLRSRLSAAYKAIHALIMRHGCEDFISGQPFELASFYNEKVDIHHIFPQAWCRRKGIDRKTFDAIVNKTSLSKRSNRLISGDAPSVYLRRIEQREGLSASQLDTILRSHLIEPEYLRKDDFEGFYAARLKALSDLIADALGKAVIEAHGHNEDEVEVEDDRLAEAAEDEDYGEEE